MYNFTFVLQGMIIQLKLSENMNYWNIDSSLTIKLCIVNLKLWF